MALAVAALAAGSGLHGAAAATGKVVTFAEQPGQPPTYILPLESSAEESNANFAQFANILYPSLYVFDANGKPSLAKTLSVANPPKFVQNDTVVDITLKHWRWSNGQPITARDVIFWLNLLSAVTDPNAPTIGSSTAPGPGWGFSVPGGFPENVVSYRQTGTYSLSLHLNRSYNPTWFLYNELSQITPIPQASWDRLSSSSPVGSYDLGAETRVAVAGTSPTEYVPSDPGTASTGALGVAQYLNLSAQDRSSYSQDPLWKVVDGAFKMTAYNTNGFLKLVPNSRYSGSPKPKIAAFEELPFTSDSAEYLALRSGSLTIGYVPPQDIKQRSSLERQGFKFSAWNVYGIGYASYNFTNPISGPIFQQLYFRQAIQSLVDQKQYINQFYGSYGSPTGGPVPNKPKTSFTSSLVIGSGAYPFNPTRAAKLLRTHGWDVVPGGVSSCAKPGTAAGECGAGVKLHQTAAFKLIYPSGNTPGTETVEALQSLARQKAGIDITLAAEPFGQVIGTEFNGCAPASPCSNWGVSDLFVGWTFGPDYLPTGEEIFQTGAGSNAGFYSNPTNDRNIVATTTASSTAAENAALKTYENFLARQLPAIWMPIPPLQLSMYRSKLRGVTPQGIIDQVFPQFYRFS